MPDLAQLGAHDLLREYAARGASPVEVVDALAARIAAVDPVVGGFTALSLARAREEAKTSEAAWARGKPRPLEGVPFAAKDLFDTEGVRTAYGSRMFDAHVPNRDAEAVRRARAAGAILLGKTQVHEFAWGITSVNERLGSARNPWALDRVSGGSSGGSAVVLAADEVPLALGSDTGGSIRVPAAFCGVVGLKPTYGRISGAGAWPLAFSLDHPGPMARTPLDAALLLAAVAGEDPSDPATVGAPQCDVQHDEVERGLAGLAVAVCDDLHPVPLTDDVRSAFDAACKCVEDAGGRVVDVRFPDADGIFFAFRVIQGAEALYTHRRAGLYPDRRSEYGDDVLGRLDAATEITLDQYLDASMERARIRSGFTRLFELCDVLLTPVSAGSPVAIGEETVLHHGSELTFRELVMPYTTPQDLVGLPACAVRAGFDGLGVPIGVQFTAPAWQEGTALRAAQGLYEATRDVQDRRPAVGVG
jgi:aspartyl-tRNA(Asn)/glutamyl-tRNA(Gln) amidotransferase subunit A